MHATSASDMCPFQKNEKKEKKKYLESELLTRDMRERRLAQPRRPRQQRDAHAAAALPRALGRHLGRAPPVHAVPFLEPFAESFDLRGDGGGGG